MKTILKISLVAIFFGLLIVGPKASYAWHHDHGYVSVHLGVWPGPYYSGYPYPYYDPYYYPPAYVVASSNYQPVVIKGVTYYENNGVYYVYTQYGYEAVPTPAGGAAPVVQVAAPTPTPASNTSDDTITVNVPNGKGGYTAVVIKKSGNGFTGPQGEFYAEFPKVSQLQIMYGK